MDTETLAIAVVDWISTFEGISKPCRSIRDLSDGALFYDVLSEIDNQWFSLVRSIDTGDNWVLKFNNLKKLYKVLIGYYEEVLGQNTSAVEVPNLTSIARDADVVELLKLAQLVIALAVQCENNQQYIARIQSLNQQSQHALMLSIETVMGRLANGGVVPPSPAPTTDGNTELPVPTAFISEKLELEKLNKTLAEQLDVQRNKYEQLLSDRNELRSRLQDMEQSVSQLSEAGKIDFILRTEIDNLKADLNKSENKRLEAEAVVEKQNSLIADLTKKVDETSKKAEEANRLKDQLDEFRHTADKLQKSEAIIDKYKKKLEEVGDLRKQMKVLEEQHQLQSERNSHLEDEYRKVSSFKPLMDTYKEQIGELEGKNSTLQVENSSLDFQLKDARSKLERYDYERKADQDTILALEDRIKDLELQGAGIELSGSMSDELDETSNAALKTKVVQLERELERFRAAKLSDQTDGTRVAVLENLLEDATRLKEKFEQDYRQAFERNLALENEMKQLQSVSSAEGGDNASGLRIKITEYENTISSLQARLAEAEQSLTSGRSASPSNGGNDVTNAGIPSKEEKFKRQIRQLTDDNRQAMAQVNKMLHEKEKMQSEYVETKELLHQQERVTSDLRSALAAMESRGQSSDETTQKLGSVTQKLVQSTEQNKQLHEALKRAKDHIILQEKQLKERATSLPKDGNYTEAISSFETQLKEREEEVQRLKRELSDTRAAAKREQRLMLSAWNNVGTELQKQNMTQQRTGTSMSWLAQQRKNLSPQIKRR